MKRIPVKNKFIGGLTFISRRLITFCLLVFFLVNFIIQDKEIVSAKIAALDRLMPEPRTYKHFFQTSQSGNNFESEELKEMRYYYSQVNSIIPNRPAVYGMLGFCYYHLGNTNKAIQYYQKGIKLMSGFFWFHHNLGIIYYRQGQYAKAIVAFQKVLQSDPGHAVLYITKSKVYVPFIMHEKDINKVVMENLVDGYYDSQLLMVLSYFHLKDYDNVFEKAAQALQKETGYNDLFCYYAGRAAYEKKEYNMAAYLLQQCVLNDPENADAYYYLGQSLKAMGKVIPSIQYLSKAKSLKDKKKPLADIVNQIHLQIF